MLTDFYHSILSEVSPESTVAEIILYGAQIHNCISYSITCGIMLQVISLVEICSED